MAVNKAEKEALKNIGRGSFIILLGFIFAKLMELARAVILARGLGTSGYGVYSMSFTILTLASFLCLFGLSKGVVHFISKNTEDKNRIRQIANHTFRFVLASSVILGLVLFFTRNYLASFFGMPSLSQMLVLFALSLPFFALFEIFTRIFEGFTLMRFGVILRDIGQNVIFIPLALVFLYLNFSLFGAGMAFLISYAAIFLVSFYFTIKKVNFLNAGKNSRLRWELINYSWPLMLSSFIYLLLNKIDIIFLGHFSTSAVVGGYSVASDLSHILIFLNVIVLPVFFPVMSGLFGKGRIVEAGNLFRKTTKFLVALTLPLLVVFVVFSREILLYIFGAEYAGAYKFLIILAFSSFFALASGPIDIFLSSMNRPRWVLFNNLVALVLNLVLNYILILKMGPIGVAVATLVSVFIQNYLGIFQIWLVDKIRPYSAVLIRPVIVSAALGLLVYFSKKNLAQKLHIHILLALSVLAAYGIYLLLDRKLIKFSYFLGYLKKEVIKEGLLK